jgi:hypothetical protein
MKTFTAILLLAAVFFCKSISSAADALQVSPSPLELGLNCNAVYQGFDASNNNSPTNVLYKDWVEFTTITNISLEVSFRNIGEKWVWPEILVSGLSVVWDGKAYKLAHPENFFPTSGWAIQPKLGWRGNFLASDFLIPQEALTAGRHTVAVRDVFSETNYLVSALEPEGAYSKSTKRIFAESGTLTVFTRISK